MHAAPDAIAENALGHADEFGPASHVTSVPVLTAPAHFPSLHTSTLPHPYSQSRPSGEQVDPCAGCDSGHTGLHEVDESMPPSSPPLTIPPHATANMEQAKRVERIRIRKGSTCSFSYDPCAD